MAVTTGTTTTVVSTVSYHLTSLSSDTRTSFSVPGTRCSGLVPRMSNRTVPIQAPPPPVGQVEAALDVLRGAGQYPVGTLFRIMRYMIAHWKTQLRSCMTTVSGLRTRLPWTPGSRWIILDEIFV